jgi:hypothetical protein
MQQLTGGADLLQGEQIAGRMSDAGQAVFDELL